MTVSSYRLETVAANLIEQLEGRRRSYHDRPEEWAAAAARIADEALDGVEREYREVMGGDALPAWLRREIHETFLPRYVSLSIDHNALERRGYDAWRQGDPISRIVVFLGAMALVTVVSRLIPMGPTVILGYLAALATPFVPEVRAFFYRRGYVSQLQAVLDDLERIQNQVELQPAELDEADPVPDPEPPRRLPRRGTERDH